jgi:spore coat protein CotH
VLNELCGNKVYNGNKFIELYNVGEDVATLTGWTLRKYVSDATDVEGVYNICWRAPQGLTIPVDGYLVLEADQTDPTKGFNAGLSAKKGVKFELVNGAGEVVDSFVRGEDVTPFNEVSLPENKEASFSRVPNGSGEFAYALPTPGAANGEATGEIEHEAAPITPNPGTNPSVADGLAYIFDLESLPEIHLDIPLEQWNTLLKEYDKDMNTDAYIHCDASFTKNGEKHFFADAGIRLRGNTSRRRPEAGNNGEMHKGDKADWQHVHFMLNLRKFQKDDAHELGGVRKIHLKWMKDDPAYVREVYCYNLFRRYGIEAGLRTSYCRLWLKVQGDSKEVYYGVYEMLEAVDEEYLENREALFGPGEYNLWKCGYGADLKETGGDKRFVHDDDAGTGNYPYVLKTNLDNFAAAKEQLIDFILKLNGKTGDSFKTWINQVTDVELLLKTYAVNVAVGMWDDYWGNMNNYYIYFNSNDKYDYKFFFIPYDYDNTLGTSNMIDAGRQDPTRWGDSSRKLVSKLLEYPEYRKMYLDALRELCNDDNLFGATGSMQRIAVWQNLIRAYVPNDTGEDMKIEDRPASWGNHSEYRIMSAGSNNFFTVKKNSIPQQ